MVLNVNDGSQASTADDSIGEAVDRGEPGRRRGSGPARIRRPVEAVSWGEIIGPAGWIKIGVLGGLIVLLYLPDIHRMVVTWLKDGNWSHGFLIPLFSVYFLHQRRERLAAVEAKSNWAGLVLMILSILGYLYCIYPLKMGYPKLLMLLGTIFGVVLFCRGWRVIKITWLPILFLFFAMPVPRRIYVQMTLPMRVWASKVSGAVLDLIPNLEAEVRGVVIEGFYRGEPFSLNVAEQCAGMRLMMAFLALGVAMAYLSDRPYWHRIILVMSTLPIALFCNFLRVIITGVLYTMVDKMFAGGSFHTTLGLVMLPLAFLMYWIIGELLRMLYIEEPVPEEA